MHSSGVLGFGFVPFVPLFLFFFFAFHLGGFGDHLLGGGGGGWTRFVHGQD